MEFHRSYPRPVRLYRGSSFIVSTIKQPEAYEPVLYDAEGFPVRWVPDGSVKSKQPIGFRMRRDQG